jgi:hypothetical protein
MNRVQMRTTIKTLASLIGIAVIATVLPAQAATPTVSAKVKAQLLYLVEEEKLAHDVYTALDAVSISPKFSNISDAEQTHMDYISALLVTYGIKNPTIGKAAGEFTNKSLAALYKTLVTKGKKSAIDALQVGILIEEKDLTDLETLSKTVKKADIKNISTNRIIFASDFGHFVISFMWKRFNFKIFLLERKTKQATKTKNARYSKDPIRKL